MTERNWAWEAKKLLPHLAGMLGNGVTVQAGGGSMVAHALNSGTWHTGTLAEAQAPWAVTDTVYDAHVANVNAHHNKATAGNAEITVSDPQVITLAGHDIVARHTVSGAQWSVVGVPTTPDTLGVMLASADVSAGTSALLRSNGGVLGLLGITSVANITMEPLTAVLPTGSILKDLGDYNRKWRSLYAAELYVETLVAQDVLATIGGRIMVAPTTKLIADLAPGGTTIDVEHNNLTSAFVYMASAPGGMAQVEVMKCGATATPIAGGYRYTVTRNLDGSGANTWVAGDAIANIGAVAGQGWIELTSTNTARNHLGPTIAIYARTGTAAWTDVKPVVALGNLRSFVDYAADQYGFGLGNDLDLLPTTGFSGMTGDRTNGLRLFNTDIELYASGTKFAWIDTTDGFTIVPSNDWQELRAYSFSNGTTTWGGMFAKEDISTFRSIRIQNVGSAPGKQYEIIVLAQGENANGPASVLVQALGGGASNYSATLYLGADIANSNKGYAYLQAGDTTLALDGASNVATLTAGVLAATGAGAFVGALTASDGAIGMSIGAPYYGVSIRAPAGSWTRGFQFCNSADVVLGGFGAYGSGNTISWYWIGNAYNDCSIRTYPTTGNTEITGTLDVGGAISRDGVAGGIFVPMTPTNLTDTGSTVWSGVSRAAGTYTFDVNLAANGSVPADAVAVAVMGTFTWTNANNATYATIQYPSAAYSIVARAIGSAIGSDVAGVVRINSSGQFTVTINNATSNTSLLRIVGYYI